MSLLTEIQEQPERLENLLESQRDAVEVIAQAIKARHVRYAFLAARGTSDNAGRYANYLWGAMNGLPIALATPSLFTYYHQPPQLQDALVVGISQSGQSPDIVAVLEEGKRQGCPTLAITNAPDSPLSHSADFRLDIHAGSELAVAATKTYTAELLAIAMLASALNGSDNHWKDLQKVPGWVRIVLEQNGAIKNNVQRYRYMQRCVVLGRGYNYASAFEWALKLKELTYIIAEPYSSADFLHGPIAMIEHGFPVLAIIPKGEVFGSMMSLLTHLKDDQQAELVVISNQDEALSMAQTCMPIPEDIPEWLTPIVDIIAAQLFSYHLTLAKGFNPDVPRSIHKVTETK
jgi:glucosamine--fructose-6-phosphate aminotransferase (isomerizing)